MNSSVNYVDKAEQVIKDLIKDNRQDSMKYPLVTTSQLRKILEEVQIIAGEVKTFQGKKLDKRLNYAVSSLEVFVAHMAGKEMKTKIFVKKANLLPMIKAAREDKEAFLDFSRYMEALVGYYDYYKGERQ